MSRMLVQKRTERYLLMALVLTASALSIATLTRGHVWGDDFAAYLMQAQSLVDGSTQEFIQRNAFTIEHSSYLLGPAAYPWGYPLLLAPVLAIFGVKALALKAVNVLFYAGFLLIFHRLARLHVPPVPALLLTAIFAFNPALLQAQDLILSDIPFLFISTLALLLIDASLSDDAAPAGDAPPAPWTAAASGAATGAVIAAAFALRTNGLLLLGVLPVAQLIRYRSPPGLRAKLSAVLALYLTFSLLAALELLLLPGGQESHLRELARLTPQIVLDNFSYYVRLPAELFDGLAFGWLFSVLIAITFAIGLFSAPRRNAALLAYLGLTIGFYSVWPEQQGLRFIFPILPCILLIAAQGWGAASDRLPEARRPIVRATGAGLVGALVILALVSSAQLGWTNLQNDREINGPYDPVSGEMFEFVRENTPPDSVMVFFKPRALRLFTDRDAFLSVSCEGYAGADYVVFHEKQGSNGQVAEPSACSNVSLRVVFNNLRFTVYEVTP